MEYSDVLERLEQFTESYFDYYKDELTPVEVAAIRHFYYAMLNNIKTHAIAQLQSEIEATCRIHHYLSR